MVNSKTEMWSACGGKGDVQSRNGNRWTLGAASARFASVTVLLEKTAFRSETSLMSTVSDETKEPRSVPRVQWKDGNRTARR